MKDTNTLRQFILGRFEVARGNVSKAQLDLFTRYGLPEGEIYDRCQKAGYSGASIAAQLAEFERQDFTIRHSVAGDAVIYPSTRWYNYRGWN